MLGLTASKCELLKVKLGYRSKAQEETNNELEMKVKRCFAEAILHKCIHSSTNDELLNSITDIEKQYYFKKVCINLDNAIQVCMKTQFQNNSLWQSERHIRITASNAYSLYTYWNNKTPDWESKVNKHLNSTFSGNADTKYGILMEDKAIQCYEYCTDFNVTKMGLLINPSIPWMGYSPDGIVKDKCIIEVKSSVIGKTVSALDAIDSIKCLEYDDEGNVVLKEKHKYFCQVQLGMFITGLLFCHFIVYSSFDDSVLIVEVPYNRELVVNNYIPVLEQIYFQHILKVLVCNVSNEEKENNSNNNK